MVDFAFLKNRVYVCNHFKGHYPVGTTCAVVVAPNPVKAAAALQKALIERGLPQPIEPSQMGLVVTDAPQVIILADGNY